MDKFTRHNNRISEILFFVIIPIFGAMPITNFLNDWYYKFQTSLFSTDNTLLFIYSKVTEIIIFFGPYIILFLIMLSLRNVSSIRIMKIKVFLLVAIVTFIISTFILVFQFFEYTNINKDGIYVGRGISLLNKDYMWNDVSYAEVSYKTGNKGKIDIIYNIYLDDGTKINVRNSKDFFNRIVDLDNFMKDKKIKINRRTIEPDDYGKIENTYNNDREGKDISETMQVVLQILNK